MRKTLFIPGCIAALVFAGCTGESNRPVATGDGLVRAINAIPTSPSVLFMIEERSIGTVEYSNVSNQNRFDDLNYIFNFEVLFPTDLEQRRVASTPIKIERDREHTFVITGDLATPTIIVWEDDIREWTGTETTFQTRFAHTAESLGAIDVYFAAPGIAPAAGQDIGTLSFGEFLPAVDNTAGDFVAMFTTAGDPADILFTSNTISPNAQAGFLIFVFDATANDPGPLSVRVLTDGGGISNLSDANISPTVRFFHASTALETSDIYTDEMLMDQIVANHAFGDVTGDIDLADGNYTFTYTTAGNVGSILFEGSGTIFAATRNHIYVVGEVGELVSFIRIPDRRSVETLVKFNIVHTAVNHPLVDLYIVDAGTDITDELPRFSNLAPGSLPVSANIREGDLEIVMTTAGEKTIIAGPEPITTAVGDVIEYVSYDNVDPAIADLVLIPLP